MYEWKIVDNSYVGAGYSVEFDDGNIVTVASSSIAHPAIAIFLSDWLNQPDNELLTEQLIFENYKRKRK